MAEVVQGRDAVATRRILEALPHWFGDPEAIDGYVADAGDPSFDGLVAIERQEVVGFALIRHHFPESAELHLIAVDPAHRGRGLGRALVEAAVRDLHEQGARLLSVHTVGPSFAHDGYAATRAFYLRLGFLPLEEHEGLGWWGPTLISVRPIG